MDGLRSRHLILAAEPRWVSLPRPVSTAGWAELGDAERVPLPSAREAEAVGRVENWWWQLFHEDQRAETWARPRFDAEIDDTAPAPACAAKIVLFDLEEVPRRRQNGSFSVLLGEPVFLSRIVWRDAPGPLTDQDLDKVSAILARWPTLSSVQIVDLSPQTQVLIDGLAARGWPEVSVDPVQPALSVLALGDIDDDDDDGSRGRIRPRWFLEIRYRWWKDSLRRASFDWADTGRLAAAIDRIGSDPPVMVSASPAATARLATALDARGVSWLADPVDALGRKVPPPFPGASSGQGLGLRLAITGQGWVKLEFDVDGESTTVVGSSVFSDALSDLVTAVRKAITYDRSTWCSWNDEPGETHIVFIPDLETGETTIELWRDEQSEMGKTPRTDELLGWWRGPTHTLAACMHDAARGVL